MDDLQQTNFLYPFLNINDRKELTKELEKARKNLEATEGKLSNEKFTARAPEAVVNAEREKAEKFRALLEQLAESKARLEKLQ